MTIPPSSTIVLHEMTAQVELEIIKIYKVEVRGMKIKNLLIFSVLFFVGIIFQAGCTQETQNKLGRGIQNWTGVNGVLDIYAGDKLVKRFIKIDKLTTATGTSAGGERPYRFGYGYLDKNYNYQNDENEKKVYFEFSDYSTSYIFYESPE